MAGTDREQAALAHVRLESALDLDGRAEHIGDDPPVLVGTETARDGGAPGRRRCRRRPNRRDQRRTAAAHAGQLATAPAAAAPAAPVGARRVASARRTNAGTASIM